MLTDAASTGVLQLPKDSIVSDQNLCPDPLSRWWLLGSGLAWLILASVQSWGLILDDTKLTLVLSPLTFISQQLHIWNQQVFGGTVGQSSLIFPMGSFFAITHVLQLPTWWAERLWLALLLTVGFWGVVRVAEALGIGSRYSRILAGVAYCVAPIVVTLIRASGDLLAVVLLPWVLLPLIAGSRSGSPRRAAARSGVAVALMGGSNAIVVLAMLPVAAIWLLTRTAGARRRSLTIWWIVSVGLATFWWLSSAALAGKYGFNYLPYTETSTVTTQTTSAFESLRGASYWLDYYSLNSPLLPGAWTLVSSPIVILGTAVVTAIGLAGLCRRMPERLFLIGCLACGVLIVTAGYSGALSGPFSHTFQQLLQTKLAPFRNLSKFSPVVTLPVVLGLAHFLSTSFWQSTLKTARDTHGHLWSSRVPSLHVLRGLIWGVVVAAVVLAAAPFWQLNLYGTGGFAAIPSYWTQAGQWLDSHQAHDNAMLVPGSSFGTYTWGIPSDEPLQFLTDTSIEWRNLIPVGSNGYIQMLDAVESVLDNGIPTPGLAGYLARGGVKYVIERNDLNWKGTAGAPSPIQVHQVLTETQGLSEVAAFGPTLRLSQTQNGDLPLYGSLLPIRLRAVEIFAVRGQTSIVHTYPVADPIVLSGDVGSLLQLSGAGVVAGRTSVLAGDPKAQAVAQAPDAVWAITDGNQNRYTGFGGIRDNTSYLLSPGEVLSNTNPDVPESFQVVTGLQHETVADPRGAASVSASSYGSNFLLSDPSDGPASAFDGDPTTSWVANANNRSVGQWVAITFRRPIPMSSIVLTPLRGPSPQPDITRVTVSTDRGSVVRNIPVNAKSVLLQIPRGPSKHLRVTIDAVRGGVASTKPGAFVLGAGITDISIPGVSFEERMEVPNDESSAFSGAGRNDPVLSFSRTVANPNYFLGEQPSDDPNLARVFSIPKSMNASISGYVVATTTGGYLEKLLQSMNPTPTPITVSVSATSWLGNLPGFRPQNVVDASPLPWIAGLTDAKPSITLRWKEPREISTISLVPSPLASRPTEISITDAAGATSYEAVPPTGGDIHFGPVLTNSLTIGFVRTVHDVSLTPSSGVEYTVPVGLSSIGVPGLASPPAPTLSKPLFLPCGQGPPLTIDGTTVPTALLGTVGDLTDFTPIPFIACLPKGGLDLAGGTHSLTAPSGTSAFEVTSLVIQGTAAAPRTDTSGRSTSVDTWGPSYRTVSIKSGSAVDLAVAQNYNPGWRATLGSRVLTPIRIDGWQQGFLVPAGKGGTIDMVMVPDRTYRLTLLIGIFFLIILLLLALLPSRRRNLEPCGSKELHRFWIVLLGSVVVLTVIAGPVSLLVVPVALVARRFGTGTVAALAFLAFLVAGVAAALHPASINQSAAGAFSGTAQVASVLALAAVLASLAAKADKPEPVRPKASAQSQAAP